MPQSTEGPTRLTLACPDPADSSYVAYAVRTVDVGRVTTEQAGVISDLADSGLGV